MVEDLRLPSMVKIYFQNIRNTDSQLKVKLKKY